MGQFWPAPPERRLIQSGTVTTSAAGRVTVTYLRPFASKPDLVVTPVRTGSNVIVIDYPDTAQSATGFEVATYIAAGAITAGKASWVAIGTPA